jgi:hypothetical protein
VEEVVTSQPDPVVLVAGRFEQFKRDSRKRMLTDIPDTFQVYH